MTSIDEREVHTSILIPVGVVKCLLTTQSSQIMLLSHQEVVSQQEM